MHEQGICIRFIGLPHVRLISQVTALSSRRAPGRHTRLSTMVAPVGFPRLYAK